MQWDGLPLPASLTLANRYVPTCGVVAIVHFQALDRIEIEK